MSEALEVIHAQFKSNLDCSIDVEKGWHQIVLDCLTEVREVTSNFTITCVKEKFGGLRIYVRGVDDLGWEKVMSIIDKYENKSLALCEICGKPGVLRASCWMKVTCNEHGGTYKPMPAQVDKDHTCGTNNWNTCPECNLPSCSSCSWACYQCVKAWRHEDCAKKHAAETKHEGFANDIVYQLSRLSRDDARKTLHG